MLRKRRIGRVTAILAMLALAPVAAAQAAPGELDTSFSGDGLVFTDTGLGDEESKTLLRAPDGSLLVAGQDANEAMFVARYTSAGALDPSFGGGDGVTQIVFPGHGRGSRAEDLAFGPSGTIVVSGTARPSGGNAVFASEEVAVARLTSTGAFDGTFSTDGMETLSFPGQGFGGASVAGAVVQPDGAVAIGATVDDGDRDRIAVARLTSTGTPDSTFSGDGRVLLDFGPDTFDSAGGIALQSDGKLVVAGGSDGSLALARLTTSGAPDTTYAGDGTALPGADFTAADVALQDDGKAVAAGDQSVARVGTTGALDSSFSGPDGIATVTTGGDDSWSSLALGPNGTIVIAGRDFGPPRSVTLARLTVAGVPDTTFSGDGILASVLGDDPRAEALAVDGTGTITVTGTADMGATGDDVALGRFAPDGALDTTFGTAGVRTTNFGYGGHDAARSVRALAGGKTLVTLDLTSTGAARYLTDGSLDPGYGAGGVLASPLHGVAETTPAGELVVAGRTGDGTMQLRRYTASGAPDTTFGTSGIAALELPDDTSNWGMLTSVLLAGDGRIVVAGSVDERAFAARYLASGAPDTTFSADGYAEATPVAGSSFVLVTGAAVQENGKVLLVGYRGDSGARVVRFTSGGQLDAGFGTAGIADAGGQFPGAMTVDDAGRIIVAGSAASADFNDSAVARLTPMGARDTTFSGDGIASVNLGANDYLSAVAVDAADRIVVAGTRGGELDGEETIAGGPRPTLARFRVDGALDESFAGTGSTVIASGVRSEPEGVAFDADGKVLAVGEATATDSFGAASDAFVTRVQGGGEAGGDTTAPVTSFTNSPPTETGDTTPTFTFSATGGAATFECRVDAGEFAPCSSPHTTATLAVGGHTFEVRSIDASGNVDRTPALAGFEVTGPATPQDTTAPAIAITVPAEGQHFAAGAAVASAFACTDTGGSGVASCSGPGTVDTAVAGPHTFTVTTGDAAGNTASKTVAYVVDAPPTGGGGDGGGDGGGGGAPAGGGGTPAGGEQTPAPADTTGPAIATPASTRTLTAASNGSFAFAVGPFSEAATGTVAISSVPVSASRARAAKKKLVLRLPSKAFTAKAGQKLALRFKLSAKHRKILAKVKKIRMSGTITARDAAGNATTKKVSFTLKAPKRKR